MGIEITEKEQLMLSKTPLISSECLTHHAGAQGNMVYGLLGENSLMS